MTLMQAVLLIMSFDIHLNELVLVKGPEEELGLNTLLQPRPLLVRLRVHHLHVLALVLLWVVRLANFKCLPRQNLLLNQTTNFAADSALR